MGLPQIPELEVDVCWVPSLFTQITVVPAFITVPVGFGPNCEFTIEIVQGFPQLGAVPIDAGVATPPLDTVAYELLT